MKLRIYQVIHAQPLKLGNQRVYGSFQSTGAAPWFSSSRLARLNGREPKKPRSAEFGLG
jgi:hypothetical protein